LIKVFNGEDYEPVGYISPVAARTINENSIELTWYPNTYNRFHQVQISLPKSEIVRCIECWEFDEKPHIFVAGDWLHALHQRSFSVYAMVDAIGVKNALERNSLDRIQLLRLRDKVDELASSEPRISFVSFADSLILKSNWKVGSVHDDTEYTYEPEIFVEVAKALNNIYVAEIGLETYCVLTQGVNEYYEDDLLHISPNKNHVSLNSLGAPFAQLMEIESAARSAIKNGLHGYSELYMDSHYFHSIQFKYDFEKNVQPSNHYTCSMSGVPGQYFHGSRNLITDNLRKHD